MMKSSDFKKIAKQIIKHEKGLRDTQIMHPAREWHIGILVAFIILGGSITWSAATYYQNKQMDNLDIVVSETDPVVYREGLVEQALKDLEAKRVIRENLINKDRGDSVSTEEVVAEVDTNQTSVSTENTVSEDAVEPTPPAPIDGGAPDLSGE